MCHPRSQGIETVRRDNCLLVRKMVTVVLDKLLKERDPEAAVEHVKGLIKDLLMNKIDMSDLVVSKSLSQASCQACCYDMVLCQSCIPDHVILLLCGGAQAIQLAY